MAGTKYELSTLDYPVSSIKSLVWQVAALVSS